MISLSSTEEEKKRSSQSATGQSVKSIELLDHDGDSDGDDDDDGGRQ